MVGDNILRLRERAGRTRQEFADDVGTSRGFIYQIENGERAPSVEMLEKIARALSKLLRKEITVADLFAEDRPRREPVGSRG